MKILKRTMSAALCLAALLVPLWALAEGESAQDIFFDRGKKALALISYGEMDKALETLDFEFGEKGEFSEKNFREFIEKSFTMLKGRSVQMDVALCWREEKNGPWRLGIPLAEPLSEDVEALVLLSPDMTVFSGYEAQTWGEMTAAAETAENVIWNEAYEPGETVLFADQ